jgi:hypothetical protein
MHDYRVYVIGQDCRFINVIELNCEDDSAAIKATKPLIDGHDLELWHRDRRVARFDSRTEGGIGKPKPKPAE